MLIKISDKAKSVEHLENSELLQLAHSYELVGEIVGAEQCYRFLLERNNLYATARIRLTALLRKNKERINEALEVIDTGIALQPGNPDLHTERALVLIILNRLLDAQESTVEACCKGSTHFDVLYKLGSLCEASAYYENIPENESRIFNVCEEVDVTCFSFSPC